MALTYRAIGNVQLEQGAADSALKSYSLGQEIFERLAKFDSDNAIWSHELANTYMKIARVYDAYKDSRKAEEVRNADREILVKLVADHPDISKWKSELSEIDQQLASYGH